MKRFTLIIILLLAGLTACQSNTAGEPTATRTPAPLPGVPTLAPTQEQAATEQTIPTFTPQPTIYPVYPVGPDNFADDVNPLTGQAVDDPETLNRRPLLVKVSNESNSVRPQSGLSSADHVWEYQMEGWAQTRYTAVIYGQTPEQVGSVRSSRLIDVDHLIDMYGGLLATSGSSSNRHAGGPPRINELLRAAPWTGRVVNGDFGFSDPYLVRKPDTPRPGTSYYHTLFAIPEAIWGWAEEEGLKQRPNLNGMIFDSMPPSGGATTTEAVIDYPGRGPKHTWRWDEVSGAWLSFTEFTDTNEEEAPDRDYLTDEQLAFENVVVLFARHYEADFIEDEPNQLYAVGIDLTGEGEGYLLRDGKRYSIQWQREGQQGMLHFFTSSGQPIAFKPGQTWFNVAADGVFPPEVTFGP